MKKIVITERQKKLLAEHINQNNNLAVFNKEVKLFIAYIIRGDESKISDYWGINGFTKSEVVRRMERFGIVKKIEDEIKCPKYNFDKKIRVLYTDMFPNNDPDMLVHEEGGDAGGGTMGGDSTGMATTSSVGGSYEQPLSGIQRREIK